MHRQFFQKQKPCYISENICFVHGGFDRYSDFLSQSEKKYYWDRRLWTEALSHKNEENKEDNFEMATQFKTIFIGHTSTLNWANDLPITALNLINMDTGAGSNGKLTIIEY